MSIRLLRITPDYARVIEYAARMSTGTECGETPEQFVSNIAKAGHLSLGRFVTAEFEVTCSRSALQQWVRHKFLDFCVKSGRYVDQSNNNFILPGLQYISEENRKTILCKMKAEILRSRSVYEELVEMGVRKEDSRFVLPEAMETRFCVVASLQGWTDFCCLRNQKKSQWEIREQSKEIFNILLKECFEWFKHFQGENGYCKKKGWD